MKRVTLVKELVLEEAWCTDSFGDLEYVNYQNWVVVHHSNTELINVANAKTVVVPVAHLCNSKAVAEFDSQGQTKIVTKNKYICWSPEVEEFLQMPFSVLMEDKKLLEKINQDLLSQMDTIRTRARAISLVNNELLSKITNATFWKRLKYLFTGELE